VGTAYSASVAATGAVGTTTYSLASGVLPASGHLVLNASTGAITGTPRAADVGAYPLTVKVTDQYGDTAISGALNIAIAAAPAITFGAAPTATATDGVAYSSSLSASGGAGALTYSITVGSLPTGLILNAGTGAVTGAPTSTAQTYNFTAQAADSFGDTPATQAYSITVNPGSATHFAVTSPTTVTAGGTVNFTVTALDAYGNTATGYAGTVRFTSTDAQAALPANSTLTSGTGGFGATPKTAGSQTITATDTTNIAIVGTSGNITVNPGTATKFLVAAPSTATIATAFSFTVTAQDTYNNTATGYVGTIHFTSSDGAATLPANSGLTSGTGSFQATLNTNGTQTITATDAGSPATGTSGTITVSNPTPVQLPTPSGTVPGSGAVNQSYPGSIQATGGVGPFTWTINGQPTTGGYSLGDGITATSTGGSTLSFSGTPTSATTIGPFTVNVMDSALPTHTFANNNYSIVVNPAGGTISGQINLMNGCNVSTTPAYAVTATNTSNTTINAVISGNQFTFSNVPPGTYTINTPTVTGVTSSLFYPANIPNVVVSTGSNITGRNFGVALGYTVQGNVAYSGTQTGQTYVVLNDNNCGGNGGPGTSITTDGAFTIRGVPPGSYTLHAWMDPLGQGAQNAIDPIGSASSPLTVTSATATNGTVTNANVTITDPATFVAPTSNPALAGVIPTATGFLIAFQPSIVTNNSLSTYGDEDATEYLVQWSTSQTLGSGMNNNQFATISGSHAFAAVGTKGNVWALNNTVLAGSGFSFTPGTTYYFQARSINNADNLDLHSSWCNYTSTGCSGTTGFIGTSIGTIPCSGTCTIVSGTVTIPSSVTLVSGAPLYVGLFQQSSSGSPNAIYAEEITNPVVGGSGNSYSITVPSNSGTNTESYNLFGILDQNVGTGTFGVVDAPGEVSNIQGNDASISFTTTGSTMTENLPACTTIQNGTCMPYAGGGTNVTTLYFSKACATCLQFSPSYNLSLQVGEQNKLPVAVTLISGPNMINNNGTVAIDLGSSTFCQNCGSGRSGQFQYVAALPGYTPSVGDTYTFNVTYSDASTSTQVGAVTAFGTTGQVVGANGTNGVPTNLQTTAGTTPNFSWIDSSTALGSGYYYSFFINQASGTCPTSGCNIWQIPGNNSNSNSLSSSTTSLTWGTDPTGGGSTPSGPLNSADDYNWSISVRDSNANQAQTQVTDNNP
jgi:hypothetical protein